MLRSTASTLLVLTLAQALNAQVAVPASTARTLSAAPDPTTPPLSLEECIALAMKKNFDLQIQGFTTEVARENLIIAKADQLPTITASTNRRLQGAFIAVLQPDGTTILIPRSSDATTFSLGISERLPWTNGTFSLSNDVNHNSAQRPPYSTNLGATLNQPLLKNSGRINAQAAQDRSKLALSIAQINYRSRVLTVIRDTENAYYDLVAAREALRIRQLTLQTSQRLFEENQARRSSGVATDLDVLSAEVGVANGRRTVVQAEQLVRQREDALATLLNTFNPDVRPGPVSFTEAVTAPPSFAASYKLARERYPDTLTAEQQIKQLEIDVAQTKRNRLPTLNLTASVSYSNTDDRSYIGSVRALPDEDSRGDDRRLALSYSMPWGMQADRARHRTAVLNLNSQKTRLEQLELNLLVQVRNAVRAVETNLVAVEIAAKATQLAAREADQQKSRFDAGLATSRLVLEAQDRLENARLNELNAKVQLRGATAELTRLEGTSIERFGVQIPQ